jgi:hypothetical protein
VAIFTQEQFLAFELSNALNDKKHFGFYCSLAKKFSTLFLLKTLRECQEQKNWPKVKNRGAYFTKTFFKKLA